MMMTLEKKADVEEFHPSKVTYTVTFESNVGLPAADPQTVLSGECATEPTPTEYGLYNFREFYSDNEYTQVFDFSTPITADTVVYCYYDPKDIGIISLVSPDEGEAILKYQPIGGEEESITLTVGGMISEFVTLPVANPGDALSTVYTSIVLYDNTETNSLDLSDRTLTGITYIEVAVPTEQPDNEQPIGG